MTYRDAMSGVRAATVLALWGAAYRGGLASPDEVIAELGTAGRTAGVRAADSGTAERIGLPGPGEATSGSVVLLELLRRGGRPWLVLPVAGDVRGLPVRSPALVPALDAGAAVLLPHESVAVVPGEGHWRVYPACRDYADVVPAQQVPPLFDAERGLDDAIRVATRQLTRLDIARDAAGVRDMIALQMRQAAVQVPRGSSSTHRHGSMLLAKVVSLEALLQVAAGHRTAAVTRHQLASLDDALRPLAAAVRFGRLAAVAELVGDMTPAATSPEPDGGNWVVADSERRKRSN